MINFLLLHKPGQRFLKRFANKQIRSIILKLKPFSINTQTLQLEQTKMRNSRILNQYVFSFSSKKVGPKNNQYQKSQSNLSSKDTNSKKDIDYTEPQSDPKMSKQQFTIKKLQDQMPWFLKQYFGKFISNQRVKKFIIWADNYLIYAAIFLAFALIYYGYWLYPVMMKQITDFSSFVQIVTGKEDQIKELLDIFLTSYKVDNFVQDSVSQELMEFFNSPFIHQTVYFVFGPEGIGKSTAAKHFVNQKVKNKEPVLYINLAQMKSITKNDQQLLDYLLSKSNFAMLVYFLITNYALYTRLYQLKYQVQLLKGHRLVIILDEIDLIKKCLKTSPQKFADVVKKIYSLHVTGGKIIVLSNDKQFFLQNFVKIPTIQGNKVVFSEIGHPPRDNLRKILTTEGVSSNAQSQILQYHSIRGQMQPAVNQYLGKKIIQQPPQKVAQSAPMSIEQKQQRQGSVLQQLPKTIQIPQQQKMNKLRTKLLQDLANAKSLIEESLTRNKSQKQSILMKVCQNKASRKQNMSPQMQSTISIKKQLQQSKILLQNQFRSKIILTGFQEYAKQKLNKGKKFKCNGEYFN